MQYVKYKELTKEFKFSKAFNKDDLPGYIKHYILDNELILVAYKTDRDHGVFTDSKIVLFDSFNKNSKQIYTIPYRSISTISVTFEEDSGVLNLFLDCSYPVNLRFINMKPEDKIRLRILYTCISRIVSGQDLLKGDLDRLINDEIMKLKY